MDIGNLKVIRGVQGGIPLYYQGYVVGAIGVSGAKPIDKAIALKGIEKLENLPNPINKKLYLLKNPDLILIKKDELFVLIYSNVYRRI